MHIGLIPDGNRRFMSKQGITNLFDSYKMGITRFYDFLEWCMHRGVAQVTIYALSTENIENRSKSEIKTLYKVFSEQAKNALDDQRIHDNKIRVNVCGDLKLLKENGRAGSQADELIANLKNLEDATRDYDSLQLNLAIAYGGRQEILHAAGKAAASGEPITEETIRKHLWVTDDPEIIIRTSEDRLSNFLTWQSAYSEIYFIPKLWQEFERNDLEAILDDYGSRHRRFGK